MATQITATLPTLDFPQEVDYPTQEDWAAFSAAAELNFGILGGDWSTQMQLWKTEANAMSTELNNSADIAQSTVNYKGDWISQGYALNESVSVSGIYYICKLTHTTGQNPTTGGSIYWNLAFGNWNLKVNNYGDETIGGTKTFISNIVGNITGNSDTATKLQTARTINGVAFDGSVGISVGLDNQSGAFSTSFTLDTSHKNRLLVCENGITITLPTINTIKSGDLFIINNAGTGILSLVTNENSTNLSRLTILAGEVLILQSDGGAFYRLVSRSKDYQSNMNAAAGYAYLPNGLIMQWGYSFTVIGAGGTLDITFPLTFPNGVFYSDMAVVDTNVNKQISTPFVVATSSSNLHIYNTDVDSPITQIRWLAIGN